MSLRALRFRSIRTETGAADLDAKYRFLGMFGADSGGPPNSRVEVARARGLYRAASRLAGRKARRQRVLDFGGGDSRLMRMFLAAGCE